MPRTYDFDAGTVTTSLDFDTMPDEDFADMLASGIKSDDLNALAGRLLESAQAQQMVAKALLWAYKVGMAGTSLVIG